METERRDREGRAGEVCDLQEVQARRDYASPRRGEPEACPDGGGKCSIN